MDDPKNTSEGIMSLHEKMMRRALLLARRAAEAGEVPVGAMVAVGDRVVAEGHNLVETENDPTRHAEMVALRAARAALGQRWLTDATLYVTLEPCAMCAGAIVLSRVMAVVFGASDPKGGAMGSLYKVGVDGRLNHTVSCTGGVLADECGALLTAFFRDRRSQS